MHELFCDKNLEQLQIWLALDRFKAFELLPKNPYDTGQNGMFRIQSYNEIADNLWFCFSRLEILILLHVFYREIQNE